jgi:hypothetical protein
MVTPSTVPILNDCAWAVAVRPQSAPHSATSMIHLARSRVRRPGVRVRTTPAGHRFLFMGLFLSMRRVLNGANQYYRVHV